MFYLDLFRALDEHHVRYVLVGGRPLDLADIDALVALQRLGLAR